MRLALGAGSTIRALGSGLRRHDGSIFYPLLPRRREFRIAGEGERTAGLTYGFFGVPLPWFFVLGSVNNLSALQSPGLIP